MNNDYVPQNQQNMINMNYQNIINSNKNKVSINPIP